VTDHIFCFSGDVSRWRFDAVVLQMFRSIIANVFNSKIPERVPRTLGHAIGAARHGR